MGRHVAAFRRLSSVIAAAVAVGAFMAPTAAAAGTRKSTTTTKSTGKASVKPDNPGNGNGNGNGKPSPSPSPTPTATPSPTPTQTTPPPSTGSARTLVVYDGSGEWGHLGELYATMIANLTGHFGTYTATPVNKYTAGQMSNYTGVVYVGSTWDEALPVAFLDDVLAGKTPVMWINRNIWTLTGHATPAAFKEKYGWMWWHFDQDDIRQIRYKGQTILRDPNNPRGVMDYEFMDPAKVEVLATAVRPDGTTLPWAVRSGNLTYIGENPLSYINENDRYMIFADLLFDLLAPNTPERHRAMIRLEDVGPDADPQELRAAADYLSRAGVPFSFGVYTVWKDPNNILGLGIDTLRMRDVPQVVDAIKYMISKGGVMLMHGYTHQYESAMNPYSGLSGDDFEFFTAHIDAENYVRLDGPVPNDSAAYVQDRVRLAKREFEASKLPVPTIWEFPHYAGSALDYKTIAGLFTTRYERSLYFSGVLSGTTPSTSVNRMVGQYFPYVVNDVYGSKVLPENLGNYEPVMVNNHPPRSPAQMIESAQRNLVVRDGFASFFYHPYYGVENLRQTVEGIKALGYTFVSPTSL
jgi:uncharacterized protein YdaL